MRIAILISGLLRDADKIFPLTMKQLVNLNEHVRFDPFVSVSASRYNGEDLKSSTSVTKDLLFKIFPNIPSSRLEISDSENMPGRFQTLRLHHMRWRMQRVWRLLIASNISHTYQYVVWMRPDVFIERPFNFVTQSIKKDVHSLPGIDNDYDFSFWGTLNSMSMLMNQFNDEFTGRCKCRNDVPIISSKFPMSPQVCHQTPGSNGGITYCVLIQHLEAHGSHLVLANYSLTRLVSVSRCAKGDTSHCLPSVDTTHTPIKHDAPPDDNSFTEENVL